MYCRCCCKCAWYFYVGTCVVVKNLFHNTPVRKAYCSSVKKQRGEMREVEKLLTTYSLVQCAVRFSLSHNNSIIMTRNATPGSRLALLAVVGHTTLAHMKHVSAVDSNNKVSLFLFHIRQQYLWWRRCRCLVYIASCQQIYLSQIMENPLG